MILSSFSFKLANRFFRAPFSPAPFPQALRQSFSLSYPHSARPSPVHLLTRYSIMSSKDTLTDLPDLIVIKQLTVRMIVGVDNWERVQAQPVTIDARIHTDVSQAGQSDHLPHSIHYGVLVKQLEAHCAANKYRSLEALADGLAKVCIFVCHAPRVTINVEKPRSLLHAASAGVEIVRTASDFVDPQGNPMSPVPEPLTHQLMQTLRLSPTSSLALHDKVIVRDLVINAILGVNPWEREDKQDVKINLVIYSGFERIRQAQRNPSALNDVVNRPHNYRTIVRSITEYVESSAYKTVESLATSIARVAILQNNVERIQVSVDKPSAIMFANSAGVQVDRSRQFFENEARQHQAQVRGSTQSDDTTTVQPTQVQPAASSLASTPSSGWHIAAIALGSNIGDRVANVENAVRALSEADGCVLVDTSFLYETAPMYYLDQPSFLNGACKIATTLSPHQLLKLTQSIEVNLGRDKTGVPDKGPRSVDLDILLYDNIELDDSPTLTIPHPGIKEREFVLEPLKDILPEFEHPTLSRTIAQLLTMLQKSPDYTPSGIRKVTPLKINDSQQAVQETSLLSWGSKTFIMGIINATPDSFSDGGDNLPLDSALQTAISMSQEGADILDIGGMSTAPNAAEITEEEEIRRVCPLIRSIREAGITTPISVDTFRAAVAGKALEAGANIINDVSGGERDPRILQVAQQWACPIVLMHMRGDSKTMSKMVAYEGGDVVAGVRTELEERLNNALRAGVRRWNIILDPGIGFAKDQQGNVDLIKKLADLTKNSRGTKSSSRASLRYQNGLSSASHATSRAITPSASTQSLAALAAADPATSHSQLDYELATQPNCALSAFPVLLGPSRKRFLGAITGKSEPKERVFATAAACAAGIASGVDIIRVHDVKEMLDVARTSDAFYRS